MDQHAGRFPESLLEENMSQEGNGGPNLKTESCVDLKGQDKDKTVAGL